MIPAEISLTIWSRSNSKRSPGVVFGAAEVQISARPAPGALFQKEK